jgi:hypothetical protein
MTPPPMPLVQVYSPDGTLGDIPYDKLHDALSAGAIPASKIKAPDGTVGYVPANRRAEALAAGGQAVPLDLNDADGGKPGFWQRAHQFFQNPSGQTMEEMQKSNISAGQFGAESLGGTIVAGPAARLVESSALPTMRALPVVGKVVSAVENAPGWVGKVAGGATAGGVGGGTEALVRGKRPGEIASEAGKGALIGGAMGLALPVMSKLAKFQGPGQFAPLPAEAETPSPEVETPTGPTPPALSGGPTSFKQPSTASQVGDIVNQATGTKPLQPNVPLKQQITLSQPETSTLPREVGGTTADEQFEKSFGPEYQHVRDQAEWDTGNPEGNFAKPSETPKTESPASSSGEADPIKVKYPDPAQRQMVRANGERIVQAVGDDQDLMKQVHDLTRVDLRQAAINHGIDMGQTTVSNSKFAGEGSVTRENMFNTLLDRGASPQDIVRLAKSPDISTLQTASEKPWEIHNLNKDHNIPSDEGYLYHATNAERAHDIAESGLDVHKPSYGTDQDVWPDGSAANRSYFTKNASQAWHFAPEEGQGAILRMKQDPNVHFKESGTGDFYSKTKIPSTKLDVLGDDKQWHPLASLTKQAPQ